MSPQNSMTATQVNPLGNKKFAPPNIWDRNFDLEMARMGKALNKFIDIKKHLRATLGKTYEYVMTCVDLTRRFGWGFHFSNVEFTEFTQGSLSDRTLKRRKVEAKDWVTVAHGTKNRTLYYLNKGKFASFVNNLLIKLGIQQGQIGPSHIISNDSQDKISSTNLYLQEKDFIETRQRQVEVQRAAQEYERIMTSPKAEKGEQMPRPTRNIDEIHPVFLSAIERKVRNLAPPQRSVFEKLAALGVYNNLAIKWVNKYDAWQLESLVEATKINCTNGKPWTYLSSSIAQLQAEIDHHVEIKPETIQSIVEPESSMSKASPESAKLVLDQIKKGLGKTLGSIQDNNKI